MNKNMLAMFCYYRILLFCLFLCMPVYFILFNSKMFYNQDTIVKPDGLKVNGRNFTLNHRNFRILSGSLHYFRIPSDAWEDRLLKLKAMGLNTVDIYIPWNLHEPQPGVFDFEGQLDLVQFLHKIQDLELYAIVHPGPYICAELDLGGLPSWLLRKQIKLRSTDQIYREAVESYFQVLVKILKKFQFGHGGSIIAFQIENYLRSNGRDSSYMDFVKMALEVKGLNELFFVGDRMSGLDKYNRFPEVLKTVNFMSLKKERIISQLEELQPNHPLFVSRLWCGWFDHWGEKHHVVSDDTVTEAVEYILKRGGSLNLYMLHGGTNFGFMNGANADNDGSNYKSTVTSYDYNAPISEYGRLTKKYDKLKKVLKEFAPDAVPDNLPWTNDSPFTAYGSILLMKEMSVLDTLQYLDEELHRFPVNMENLNANNFSGQSYGYTLYKTQIKKIPGNSVLNVTKVRDSLIVIINNEVVYTTFENFTNVLVQLDNHLKDKASTALYLLVENCGRVNYGRDINNQRKGILGPVFYGGRELKNWRIYALEFKREWVNNLATSASWKDSGKEETTKKVPKLYKGNLYVHKNAPSDTNLILPGWFKGAVFVNGYNMGRYWNRGPQLSLFLPGLWLRGGNNTVVVFDLHGSPLKYEEHFPVIESVFESYLGDITMFRI